MFDVKIVIDAATELSKSDKSIDADFIVRLANSLQAGEEFISLGIATRAGSLTALQTAATKTKPEVVPEIEKFVAAVFTKLADQITSMRFIVDHCCSLMSESSDQNLVMKATFISSVSNNVITKSTPVDSVRHELIPPMSARRPPAAKAVEEVPPIAQPDQASPKPVERPPSARPRVVVEKPLKDRAEAGEPAAMFEYAMKVRAGDGYPKSRKVWIANLKGSADAGYAPAQYEYGHMLFHGTEPIQEDLMEATKYFKMAAEQGDANSEYRYAYALYSGKGEKRDYQKAAEMMKRAADKGVAGAQYFYGYFCMRGLGLDAKMPDQAELYLKKAAEQGDKRAKDTLADLKSHRKSHK